MNHLDLQIIMTIETKSIKKNKRYRIDGSRVDGICKREGGCVYGREGGGGKERGYSDFIHLPEEYKTAKGETRAKNCQTQRR